MHALLKLAAQAMRTRLSTDTMHGIRDLTSYMVNSSLLANFHVCDNIHCLRQLEGGASVKDLELDAVVAMVGGAFDS